MNKSSWCSLSSSRFPADKCETPQWGQRPSLLIKAMPPNENKTKKERATDGPNGFASQRLMKTTTTVAN
jgi:hypothetical protein